MKKKIVIIVSMILVSVVLYLLLIFKDYPTIDSASLLASYRQMSQYYTYPVTVEEMQRLVNDFVQAVGGDATVTVPVRPAGPNSTTSLVAGKIYFHQSSKMSCACLTHGVWSTATWGSGSSTAKFASNGCAVYSLSMAISNLLQQNVDPVTLLTGLGCKVLNKGSGGAVIDTSGSACFEGVAIYREKTLQEVQRIYGLQYKEIKNADEASSALGSGAILWTCVKGSRWNTTSNTHFVAIYAQDGMNYYAYDSSNLNYTNNAEPVGAFWSTHRQGPVFAISRR